MPELLEVTGDSSSTEPMPTEDTTEDRAIARERWLRERLRDTTLSPDERRKLGGEMLRLWITLAERPTPEGEREQREFFRAIDSHRPHRPLFEEYCKEFES